MYKVFESRKLSSFGQAINMLLYAAIQILGSN